MQLNIALEPEIGLSRVTVRGDVRLSDFPAVLHQLWSNAEYIKTTISIWDFSESDIKLGFEEVAELSDFVKKNKNMRGPNTIAIVASRDLEFGIGRMFGAFSGAMENKDAYKVSVFRNQEHAKAWLLGQVQA